LAKKRVKAKRGVLTHFVTCFAVSIFLVFIYATTGGDYFWPSWPIAGMTLSVVIHAGVVYSDMFNFESSVEKEYQKLKINPPKTSEVRDD
jgi:hypothetical protein